MRSKFFALLICSLFCSLAASSQVIRFSSNLTATPDSIGGSFITDFRFYISNVQFFHQKKLVYADEKTHRLIDLTESNQFLIEYSIPEYYDSLSFLLGVDQETALSGVFGGDLDPSKGMYWTWHSGYIHVKLEGYSPLCASRNHKFQYHIGGQGSAVPMGFRISRNDPMHFQVDLKRWLYQQPFETTEIMVSGETADTFAKYFSTFFILNP